ncbi:MAG TPA: hypothetical protein VG816_01805 [Solirubrobacterales bacterium]|nr:hypothetical protein [Solirubrobacterales bacterium]
MLKSSKNQASLASMGKKMILLTFFLNGVLACLTAAPANAARVHALISSEALPNGESVYDIAVNQTTHHFYITPLSIQRNVYNFDPDGELDKALPELPGATTLEPLYVGIDKSGGAYGGYLYAASVFNGTIQQYDPSGTATAVKITETAIPPNGTAQSGLAPVVNNGSFRPRAVAISPTGDVFTYDQDTGKIDQFTPTGTFVAQLGLDGVGSLNGIEVDASGNLYLAAANGLFKLDSSGKCVPVSCEPIVAESSSDVTVDRSTGRIFTAGDASKFSDDEGKFSEYDSAGNLLGVTRPKELHKPSGIAVDEASGKLIVGEQRPNEPEYRIFGPVEIVPDVESEAAGEVTDNSATLKGKIGAAEVPGATCVFQYADEEEFQAHRFQRAAETICEPEGPFSGSTMHAVEAHLSGLRGGTIYHYRLVGSNENGSNAAEEAEFTTKGPSISDEEVFGVTETAATLEGEVNPNGEPTTYRFQYVTQADFEEGGYAGAKEIPVGGAFLGEGTEAISLSEEVKGLSSGTSYRFRIFAEGSEGTTVGADEAFSTFAPSSAGLPDGRAYEQASPLEKGGSSLQGEKNAVRASTDGSRITFFSNAGIAGVGEGEQNFPTYLATRFSDGSGWSTQGLFPPASFGPAANIVGWNEELSEVYDFASEPAGPARLLVRSSVGGSLTEVASLAEPWTASPFHFAGVSAGGNVALLESDEGKLLPGDLPGKRNLYAYDRKTGSLVVAGVMNDGTVPPGGTMGGSYGWFFGGAVSSGGAAATYFTQDQRAISTDGNRIFFTAAGTGQLYVRENPLAPQSSISGEQCTEPAKACTVRVSEPEEGVTDPATPAAFVGASADGSLVYFLDKGKLTADSTAKGYDLYRYDLEDGDLTDLTVDHADPKGAQVEGVLGIGKSGEDIYFVATGALTEDASKAPAGLTNLYAVHGTTTELITQLPNTQEREALNWTPLSVSSGGVLLTHTSRVSADGQTLLFTASSQLTSYRSHGTTELYLFRPGGQLRCVSCNPTRERPRGRAGVQEVPQPGFSPRRDYAFVTRNLSADGKRVIFDSADQLLASDENGVNDVYEWEQRGKGSCQDETYAGGCLFLISSGTSSKPSYFADADTEGENVFFFTEQQLVAQDKDQLVDVYDARVNGGIAAQDQLSSPACEGEACLGPGSSGGAANPGTASFSGSGDIRRPPPCVKGRIRRHGRCVKHGRGKKKDARKHHKRHSGRRAARAQEG